MTQQEDLRATVGCGHTLGIDVPNYREQIRLWKGCQGITHTPKEASTKWNAMPVLKRKIKNWNETLKSNWYSPSRVAQLVRASS